MRKIILKLSILLLLVSCAEKSKFDTYKQESLNSNESLTIPELKLSPVEIKSAWQNAKIKATSEIDSVGRLPLDLVTYENSILALEDIRLEASNVISRLYLIWNTSPDETTRDAAREQVEDYDQWEIQ